MLTPQALEPVDTTVATSTAKQSVLACKSKEEVKELKANWSDGFRKQVGSLLSESERTTLSQLPESIPTLLTVEDFEIGQRVKFNRAEAIPSSAVRIPENVESGEVVEHSVSLVKVRWDELETPQFHKPIELSIVEKDG